MYKNASNVLTDLLDYVLWALIIFCIVIRDIFFIEYFHNGTDLTYIKNLYRD